MTWNGAAFPSLKLFGTKEETFSIRTSISVVTSALIFSIIRTSIELNSSSLRARSMAMLVAVVYIKDFFVGQEILY